ncbi:hypothetical protein EW146_g4807 [Bondarzewia mesenterica]|uniref:Uncharacterized protein n=1 Tax=Bondarzewia mesenterica TaxID=1095465 RepID=A0A4S4LTF6_9AGAM|nr:hypothetical protein EW146_g4807 [Bondarzewia mesenterica]
MRFPLLADLRSSTRSTQQAAQQEREVQGMEAFDYQVMVNALMIQFLSEHEETRVAALKWLIMLHQKAPKKILVMDDGTFPALLKTLSDSSEEVIKHDLQLLAQISCRGSLLLIQLNIYEPGKSYAVWKAIS